MHWDKDAGMVAGVAAVVDYTGIMDRILGANGGPFMSSAMAAAATVLVMGMIYRREYHEHHKGSGTYVFNALGAGLASGVTEMILQAVLGSRIQNPQILGALGVFIGTYIAENKANTS